MRAQYSRTLTKLFTAALIGLSALLSSGARADHTPQPALEYQLEAYINGQPTGFISIPKLLRPKTPPA